MVLFIIVGAQILSSGLSYVGVPRGVSQWIVDMNLSKWTFFIALVILYVILGFFVDGISMIYITLPVLYPAIVEAGFDIIWFGVVLTILIELGQITPPVGLNLFAIHGISEGSTFNEVIIGTAPYTVLMLITIALLTKYPQLALWLTTKM
jgi:TRAP-type C4-dicarboxylate transport system permease large subunit